MQRKRTVNPDHTQNEDLGCPRERRNGPCEENGHHRYREALNEIRFQLKIRSTPELLSELCATEWNTNARTPACITLTHTSRPNMYARAVQEELKLHY